MNNSRFKFRVWDNVKKEMIYPECCEMHEDKVITLGGQLCHVNCELYEYEGEIMQSTGLYDCDGKEIWEGDILSDKKGSKVLAIFRKGAFIGEYINPKPRGMYAVCFDDNTGFKVIGNRFNNPELLEIKQ